VVSDPTDEMPDLVEVMKGSTDDEYDDEVEILPSAPVIKSAIMPFQPSSSGLRKEERKALSPPTKKQKLD